MATVTKCGAVGTRWGESNKRTRLYQLARSAACAFAGAAPRRHCRREGPRGARRCVVGRIRWLSYRAGSQISTVPLPRLDLGESPDKQRQCPRRGAIMPTRRSFLQAHRRNNDRLVRRHETGWMERAMAQIPAARSTNVTKYVTPLLIPPVMPRAATITMPGGKPGDYYEISMKQFAQQILPAGLPTTTVWGYGAVKSASNRGCCSTTRPRSPSSRPGSGRCGSSGSTTSRTPAATTCPTCCR